MQASYTQAHYLQAKTPILSLPASLYSYELDSIHRPPNIHAANMA